MKARETPNTREAYFGGAEAWNTFWNSELGLLAGPNGKLPELVFDFVCLGRGH